MVGHERLNGYPCVRFEPGFWPKSSTWNKAHPFPLLVWPKASNLLTSLFRGFFLCSRRRLPARPQRGHARKTRLARPPKTSGRRKGRGPRETRGLRATSCGVQAAQDGFFGESSGSRSGPGAAPRRPTKPKGRGCGGGTRRRSVVRG